MLLPNHGSLTVGRTMPEAFVLMETLDRACDVQLRAQAAGVPLRQPSEAVCANKNAPSCKQSRKPPSRPWRAHPNPWTS
jgi:ribulose-5-phosphate 4-epimerase/fuculose-1-phosphate aldolase